MELSEAIPSSKMSQSARKKNQKSLYDLERSDIEQKPKTKQDLKLIKRTLLDTYQQRPKDT